MDRGRLAWAVLALLWQAGRSQAVDFAFNFAPDVPPEMAKAVESAGARWSEIFADPIVIRIDVDLGTLQPGWLAQTKPMVRPIPYARARDALGNDATSQDDIGSVAHLQRGDRMRLLLNRTSTNPNGAGSAVPWLDEDGDANNTYLRPTTANLKALGQAQGPALVDGRITLSASAVWDVDAADGTSASAYDLAGVAAHEIAHVMGFSSGVEYLETYPGLADSSLAYVTTLDLFRFSEASAAQGAADWTADGRDKFLSLDGGSTRLATMAGGSVFGDGRQVSHWRHADTLMDPAIARGSAPRIGEIDVRALDVIGYDRRDAVASIIGTGAAGLPILRVDAAGTMGPDGGVFVAGQIRIGAGALLDPGDALLVLRGDDDPAALLAQLEPFLDRSDNPLRVIAAILNRDREGNPLHGELRGAAVGPGDLLVALTWAGDMDLDGRITGRDYDLLHDGMAMGLGGYAGGDLNRDGLADGDDYFLIDRAFMAQPAELPSVRLGITVPEPGVVLGGAIGALWLARRRQRTATMTRSVLDSRS